LIDTISTHVSVVAQAIIKHFNVNSKASNTFFIPCFAAPPNGPVENEVKQP
jgi:hypothetical protein